MLFCTPFSSSWWLFLRCFDCGLCHKQERSSDKGCTSRLRPRFDECDVHAAFACHASRHYRGWEELLGVEVGSSPIKGSQIKFLCTLIDDAQTRFNISQLVCSATVEDSVEASSCSCERVMSYVMATPFGQSTERRYETLWVRCNGEALENWGPFEVFDELRKTPFRPQKRKQGHVVEVEDGGLLGFAAFKDLQVSLEEDAKAEVVFSTQDLWVVPKTATCDNDIGYVYGVGLEDEDEDADDENVD